MWHNSTHSPARCSPSPVPPCLWADKSKEHQRFQALLVTSSSSSSPGSVTSASHTATGQNVAETLGKVCVTEQSSSALLRLVLAVPNLLLAPSDCDRFQGRL